MEGDWGLATAIGTMDLNSAPAKLLCSRGGAEDWENAENCGTEAF